MFERLFKNGRDLFTKENSSILSAAIIIMGATFLSAILGFIRTRLLIQYFFTDSRALDAFWAAFRIPDTVFQLLVVGALSAAFIPVFSKYLDHGREEEASRIASSMINVVVGIMLIATAGIVIWADPLSHLVAGGFSAAEIATMVKLTRVMALADALFGFSSFLTGIIQSHKRFIVPAISPCLYNVGIILGTVFLSKPLGIMGPAVGVVLGAVLHLLVQVPLAYHLGFRYKFKIERHPAVSEMGRLMLPRTITLSLAQIEQTVAIAFASWLGIGSVTIISIAQQLANLPIRMIGVTIGQASLPFFSKETAKNDLQGLAAMVNNAILQMFYLALPASAIVLVLRIPLVRLAYGAVSFPWNDTVLTGKVVAVLALGIIAGSLTHIVVRAFYSLHDTKTPFIANLISTSINVSLSYYLLFVVQTGIIGMAFAMTLGDTIETIILTAILYNRAHFALHDILDPAGRMVLAAVTTAVCLWLPLHLLDQFIFDTTHTLPLIALTVTATLIGLGVYILASYALHIKELELIFSLFHKVGDWRKVLRSSSEPIETVESTDVSA